MKDILKKTGKELVEHIMKQREALRVERFKDKATKKAGNIRSAKKEIARGLTELTARIKANTKVSAGNDSN